VTRSGVLKIRVGNDGEETGPHTRGFRKEHPGRWEKRGSLVSGGKKGAGRMIKTVLGNFRGEHKKKSLLENEKGENKCSKTMKEKWGGRSPLSKVF